ncbi:hypothetical protein DVH05_018846 [Phytophthora capsici]|nr:hypothetical protein DVH05_018846 [Phytophthora capsici]
MSLSGKVVVVTGASGGIGAAITLELVKAGAKVAIGARRQEALEEVKANVYRFYRSAGVMHVQLLKNVNQDNWERTIDINCKGTLNGVAVVLPKMLARKSGHIVNISSDAGRKVFAGLGVYSASKMFIEGISQALRLENVDSGLRVTSIQPGDVTTFLVDHANAVSGVDDEAAKLFDEEPGKAIPVEMLGISYDLSTTSRVRRASTRRCRPRRTVRRYPAASCGRERSSGATA